MRRRTRPGEEVLLCPGAGASGAALVNLGGGGPAPAGP